MDLHLDKDRGSTSRGRRGAHGRANSFRSAPYQVQVAFSLNISADLKRRVSANAVPTGSKADTENAWKHDLYKTVNKPSNANTNACGGKGKAEEVIQFPRRKYTEQEKAQVRFL